MTASVSSPTPAAARAVRPATAAIDASMRAPMVLLAGGAVKWLILSLAAGFLATMKLHGPGALAGIPALTFGRLAALQDAVFIFGFASQAAIAVALWLICRLGGTTLVGAGSVVVGTFIWNLGVIVGSLGILAGNGSPFEHLQFPHSAYPVLFIAYCVIGVCALLTFASRKEPVMYPSLWFVLAALLFFPWTLISASMTLWSDTVGGAAMPLIAAWAANSLLMSWLAPVALAALFYLLPKLTGKSLHSAGLAVFGFWLFLMLGQTTGMHATASFPSWVDATSEIATVLLVLPGAAIAINWRLTLRGTGRKIAADPAFRFAWWGAAFFVFWILVSALAALRPVNRLLEFSLFQTGLSQVALAGFFTMSIFAAFTYILPRTLEYEWPRPGFTAMHARFSILGALMMILPMLIGGLIHGGRLAAPSSDFMSALRGPALGMTGLSMIGMILLIVAQIPFLYNLTALMVTACRECCGGKR